MNILKMNEAYFQHQFSVNKLNNKQKMLTTRTKMKVLTSLNSECMKNLNQEVNDETKSFNTVLDQENCLTEFQYHEEIYLKDLKNLHEFLLHPMLRGSVICLDDIIKYVNDLISAHKSLLEESSSKKEFLSMFLNTVVPELKTYIKYHSAIDLEMRNFQNFCQFSEEQQWNSEYLQNLLIQPMKHISHYEKFFKNLSSLMPEEKGYKVAIEAIESTLKDINQVTFTRRNSIRMLQIQRLLTDRQPKILVLGRRVVKEGILYKVNCNGKRLKQRLFFLFDDMLMCCKIIDKAFKNQKPSTLKCCSIFPLNLCNVRFVLGQSTGKGALFKVSCENFFYLLLSKEPGESQAWVKEVQSAIDQCQPNNNFRHKEQKAKHLNLKRAFGIRKRNQPFIAKRASSSRISQTSIRSNQDDALPIQQTPISKILKWFVCVR